MSTPHHYWHQPGVTFSTTDEPGTGARGPVRVHGPYMPGFGTSRQWSRTIAGQTYSFTLVTWPTGEIRWHVTRFNGYPGGPTFGCAWSPHRHWTFKP
jgi:hypothetical protein